MAGTLAVTVTTGGTLFNPVTVGPGLVLLALTWRTRHPVDATARTRHDVDLTAQLRHPADVTAVTRHPVALTFRSE
jgi:hypothetical protein